MTVPTGRGRWLALTAALLGWMFDGMEMGLFPLVARSALGELLGPTASEHDQALWYGIVTAAFLIGAATGGVLFGWLGDKIGRIRAMTASILLYSLSSGLSAMSAEPWQLAALRFLGALGMGGEWALGVALVMELWPNASRAWLAGFIGAFGNLGYTVCGGVALLLIEIGPKLSGHLESVGIPSDLASTLTANGNWRLLLLMGALPAMLTMLIRLFVPESEKWQKEKESGAASHWATKDLIGVLIGAIIAGGVVSLWAIKDIPMPVRFLGSFVGLIGVSLGYLYPAWSYLSRAGLPEEERRQTLGRMLLGAGLSGVPLLATWGGVMWMYQWVGKLPDGNVPEARPIIQIASSLGAAAGCVIGAVLGGIFGRRIVYAGLCILSMITVVGFYQLNTHYGTTFIASAGLMGMVTAAFYGWLPLYLPELFKTAVRATGQGFGFNFGRIIAAAGNLQMSALMAFFNDDYAKACAVVPLVYAVGLILIAFSPETKGKPLPE